MIVHLYNDQTLCDPSHGAATGRRDRRSQICQTMMMSRIKLVLACTLDRELKCGAAADGMVTVGRSSLQMHCCRTLWYCVSALSGIVSRSGAHVAEPGTAPASARCRTSVTLDWRQTADMSCPSHLQNTTDFVAGIQAVRLWSSCTGQRLQHPQTMYDVSVQVPSVMTRH